MRDRKSIKNKKQRRAEETRVVRHQEDINQAIKEHNKNQIGLEAIKVELVKYNMDQTKIDDLIEESLKVDEIYKELEPTLSKIKQKLNDDIARLNYDYPKKDEEYSTRKMTIKDLYIDELISFHDDNFLDINEFVFSVMGVSVCRVDYVKEIMAILIDSQLKKDSSEVKEVQVDE